MGAWEGFGGATGRGRWLGRAKENEVEEGARETVAGGGGRGTISSVAPLLRSLVSVCRSA
jgi:hypothetical protein